MHEFLKESSTSSRGGGMKDEGCVKNSFIRYCPQPISPFFTRGQCSAVDVVGVPVPAYNRRKLMDSGREEKLVPSSSADGAERPR